MSTLILLLISTCVHFINADPPYFATQQTFARWSDAKSYCVVQGGRLASFHSIQDIQDMVDTCVGFPFLTACHVGFSDDNLDDQHEFVTGEIMNDLGAWAAGQPSAKAHPNKDTSNHHCGKVISGTGPVIYDGFCDGTLLNGEVIPLAAICEYADNPPSMGIINKPPSLPPTPGGIIVNPPVVTPKYDCTAKICAHGDNRMQLDISYDGGNKYDLAVASEGNWQNTMQYAVSPIDVNTILRFRVTDVGHIGGFLCTIQLCGNNGYVFEFYTDETNIYFEVISDSMGDPLLDVFHEFGHDPWGRFVNPDKVFCMNENADWMWNDKTLNTMEFEFNFAHHLDILQKLDCIESATPEPRNCCDVFSSIGDYLGECYCDSTPVCECKHYFDGCNTCWCDPDNNGLTVCTKIFCQPDDYQEYECFDNAQSVNQVIDDIDHIDNNNNNNNYFSNLNEQMKEIKYMIYGTWIIIFVCVGILLTINVSYCASAKKRQFKSINQSDQEV